jgi:hypothetical protein
MNGRKDDFQISLFGLPKCHFEFSQNDIERMRGFKFIFERLIATDFIKNQMAKTPIVFAGEAETTIPESTWSDFNQKFRPFILQRDRCNYAHVKRIVFRHPRCGPCLAKIFIKCFCMLTERFRTGINRPLPFLAARNTN